MSVPLCDQWLKEVIAETNPMSPLDHYDEFDQPSIQTALASPSGSDHFEWFPVPESGLGAGFGPLEVPRNSPESDYFLSLLEPVPEFEKEMEGEKEGAEGEEEKPSGETETEKSHPETHTDSSSPAEKAGLSTESSTDPINFSATEIGGFKPEILRSTRRSNRIGKPNDYFFNKVNEKLHRLKEKNCLTPEALEAVFDTKDVLKDCSLGRCKHRNGRSRKVRRRASASAPKKLVELSETSSSIRCRQSRPRSFSNDLHFMSPPDSCAGSPESELSSLFM